MFIIICSCGMAAWSNIIMEFVIKIKGYFTFVTRTDYGDYKRDVE